MHKGNTGFQNTIKQMLLLGLALLVAVGTFQGCSGDKGPAGADGEKGAKGEVGPAGDDGSVMLSGTGKPDDSKGNNGDYYLNTDTGGLFGPKESDSWNSSPAIVLKGQDGKDGSDGSDGDDGRTILSGTGAPGQSVGDVDDFYLDTSSYKLYGPKTSGSGWGSGTDLQGADGNANVTRYIFPGHDFSSSGSSSVTVKFSVENEAEFNQSADLVYLKDYTGNKILVPGSDASGSYDQVYFSFNSSTTMEEIEINETSGGGYDYTSGPGGGATEVIHIRSSSTIDMTKRAPGAIIPEGLNTDNYQEVADYYGFGSK